MLKSMTGFGVGDYDSESYKIHVEVKSVNNRYNDIVFHMPRLLNPLEDQMKKFIAGFVGRGKVDVFIAFTDATGEHKKIRVDKKLAVAYHKALNEISDLLRLARPDDVHQIAQYPEVLGIEENILDLDLFKGPFRQALEQAMTQFMAMRTAEGLHIYKDLAMRLDELAEIVTVIEKHAPQVVADYRERLQNLLAAYAMQDVDQTRVIQEVALFADKANVTEEIVRLKSHFKQFRRAIDETEGAVGRKLDFIVQEMNRETNTIASKANSAEIARLVVDMKSEIEKIREQIQNIE